MLKFLKDYFKELKVRCNDQGITGIRQVLAFIACAVAIGVIMGVFVVMIIGSLAVAVCLLPIALVFEGIRQIVEAIHDLHKYNKKKKDIKNTYSEQFQQIEENYNQNREVIDNTMESLKTSKTIIQDEKGTDVVVQELVPITLEDLEAYIQYISQFNSVEAQTLEDHLKLLREIKGRLVTTFNIKEREELECEYDNIMFIVQEKLSKHTDQINDINDNFDKSPKKRRLFK